MSKIPEEIIAALVADVSERMKDPSYAQVAIGTFAQAHPDAGRFITAHREDLGSGEAVMHAVFHAEVIHQAFQRHLGRHLTPMSFTDLDEASTEGALDKLKTRQPAVADYIASNVEGTPMQKLLAHLALTMHEK